jgi:hypothetical protein
MVALNFDSFEMIAPGKVFQFVVFIASVAALGLSLLAAKRGKVPKIRKIACLEALPELVGRAAEMGSSVHFATGSSGLETADAPIVAAGYAMLEYVAQLCGKYKVPIRYTCVYGYTSPIAQDLIKSGYLRGGHPEMYSDDMIFYAGDHQQAYAAAMMGYILREKPAANMMFGGIRYETLNCLGAGAIAGCMQVAGTPRLYYQPFLVASCDYSMIGDEMFPAAALVKGSKEELGFILGQDLIKAVALSLVVLAVVLASVGTNLFLRLAAT